MFVGQVLALNLLFGSLVSTQMAVATSIGLPAICYNTAPGSGDNQDSPAPGLPSARLYRVCILGGRASHSRRSFDFIRPG